MTRDELRERLTAGEQFEARVITTMGETLAEGKLKWQGTVWRGRAEGQAVALIIELGADRNGYRAPLINRVSVKPGDELRIEFGGKWTAANG